MTRSTGLDIQNIGPSLHHGMDIWRVGGFTTEELDMLRDMSMNERLKWIVEELDDRENKLGTRWSIGYGIYTITVRGKYVFLDVGSSCD